MVSSEWRNFLSYEKESGLPDSRAEARLLQQPSAIAPSAHPRGAFLYDRTFLSYKKIPAHNRRGFYHILLSLHRNPSKRVRHGTDQDDDRKHRTQVLNHDIEDFLSVELAFPMKYFFLNSFDPNDSGYQQAGGNGRNRHHHGVGQEIEEIQKLHADDRDIG